MCTMTDVRHVWTGLDEKTGIKQEDFKSYCLFESDGDSRLN